MMMLLYFDEVRQRTVGEYGELFGASGLELTRVVATPSAFSLVEACSVQKPHIAASDVSSTGVGQLRG